MADPVTALTIREATAADIPALARLHVTTWNDTYPGVRSPPTYELRERQWREASGERRVQRRALGESLPAGRLVVHRVS